MAVQKNESQYTVCVDTPDGIVVVAPGDDLPAGAKVDNPYVTGKVKEETPEVAAEGAGEGGDFAPRSRAAVRKG